MSRLYIRVLTGFYTHRKTIRLVSKIGSDAFWLVPRIWAYAAENQADGDLSGYAPEELAVLVGYSKDAIIMLQALKDCGFIDLDGMIHGWLEHNGYHQKYSERAKKAAAARWNKENYPQTPQKKVLKEKEESGDKHCLALEPIILVASSGLESTIEKKTGLTKSKFAPPVEVPECLRTQEFMNSWDQWQTFRRTKKAVKNWVVMLNAQLENLQKFDPHTASEMLKQSIRNDWQGVFELKDNGNGRSNGHVFVSPKDRKQAIIEKLARHPCNRSSTYGISNPSEEQKTEYRKLRDDLQAVNDILAGGGTK